MTNPRLIRDTAHSIRLGAEDIRPAGRNRVRYRASRLYRGPNTVLAADLVPLVRPGTELERLLGEVCNRVRREGQSIVIRESGGEYPSCEREAVEHAPDVALVDLIMPGGLEATRRLSARSPRTSVVMLASYHDDEHVFPAIRAGALSYVLKEVGPDELADTVSKAAAGEAVLHPRVAARVVRELHGARRDEPNPFHELSDRELEVLKLIAEGFGNAEISGRLYLSEKTVKSHVSNILGKLHLADRTQAAVYAWREGVVRRD